MSVKLSPVLQSQIFDANGNPLSGGKIETYLAGSTTPAITYSDSNGTIPQTNPIILNTRGETNNLIWLTEGALYKFILRDSLNNIIGHTYDNIQGVNDSSVDTSQWVNSNATPTYISATQFSLAGDQTSELQVNRRVKITVTAGIVYGYISVSAYTVLTTVTVVLDSGVLDTGISTLELGLLTPLTPAFPNTILKKTDLIAEVFWWPHASTPSYALLCNGAAVSRTTYAALFAKISTTWGSGDGSTTFNLPNILENQTILQANGNEGTSTVGALLDHTHTNGFNAQVLASGGGTSYAGALTSNTGSTGGSYNLAAGARGRFCIRY